MDRGTIPHDEWRVTNPIDRHTVISNVNSQCWGFTSEDILELMRRLLRDGLTCIMHGYRHYEPSKAQLSEPGYWLPVAALQRKQQPVMHKREV